MNRPCPNKDDLANHAQCTALHKPSFLGCPAAVKTREIIGSVVIVGNPVLRSSPSDLDPTDLVSSYLSWCFSYHIQIWLVVSTPLKNISQWEGLSHGLWKIKNVWNHQPEMFLLAKGLRPLKRLQFGHKLKAVAFSPYPLQEPRSVPPLAPGLNNNVQTCVSRWKV